MALFRFPHLFSFYFIPEAHFQLGNTSYWIEDIVKVLFFTFTDVERLQLVRKIDGGWRPPSEILAHQKSNLFLLCFWSLLLPVCVRRGIMEREFCLLLVGMRPLRIRTTKSSDQHELLCRFIHISSLLWVLYDYASSLWFTHICVMYWTLEFCHN